MYLTSHYVCNLSLLIQDELNIVVGVETREVTVRNRLLGRGSYVLVFNSQGELFVSRRSDGKVQSCIVPKPHCRHSCMAAAGSIWFQESTSLVLQFTNRNNQPDLALLCLIRFLPS